MTEWIECTLDKLGEIVGGATPSTKCEDYYGGSIPWITPKDLSSFKGRYITSGERNITEKGLASCSAQMMPKDAVLFTSRAPIGYVAIASQSVCTNQGFKSIVVNDKADPLFVYYLLKYNKDAIEAMGSGTTFKEVSGAPECRQGSWPGTAWRWRCSKRSSAPSWPVLQLPSGAAGQSCPCSGRCRTYS